jgi:hypothetical protein
MRRRVARRSIRFDSYQVLVRRWGMRAQRLRVTYPYLVLVQIRRVVMNDRLTITTVLQKVDFIQVHPTLLLGDMWHSLDSHLLFEDLVLGQEHTAKPSFATLLHQS